MKDKKKLLKIYFGVFLIFIFMIGFTSSASFSTFTFSRYDTETEDPGEAGIKVADWVYKVNDKSTGTVTINLVDTVDSTNKFSTDEIIPGSTGTIDIELDMTGTKVTTDYVLTKTSSNLPTNLKLYTDSSYSKEFTSTSGTISYSGDQVKDIKIYWKWNFTDTDETSTWMGKDMNVSFNIEASQKVE